MSDFGVVDVNTVQLAATIAGPLQSERLCCVQ